MQEARRLNQKELASVKFIFIFFISYIIMAYFLLDTTEMIVKASDLFIQIYDNSPNFIKEIEETKIIEGENICKLLPDTGFL